MEIALWTDDGSALAAHVLDADADADADDVAVPDHFHLEGAAALRRLEVHGEILNRQAEAVFAQFRALRVRRVDTRPLLDQAWTLRHNLTVADALYVVLARRLGVSLVSGDRRMARAPGLDIEVLGPTRRPPH